MSVEIGYARYTLSESDAVALLGIALRARRLEYVDGSYHYRVAPGSDPFFESVSFVDIAPPGANPDSPAAFEDKIPF